jgi:membrane-associated phospholipid phosphatase
MNAEFILAIRNPHSVLMGIGCLLTTLGLLHRQPALARWDARAFQIWHAQLRRYAGFFRYLWPLGTTPVGIVLILIIYLASWQAGFVATLTYILAAMLERSIKMRFQRPRPFTALADVKMCQPSQPHDPSHPSGDTLRVWFLALIFPWTFVLPWPATLLTCTIAVILSLGRIALGVHYPLDVLGGAGLGLLAAVFFTIVYQLAVIR